MIAVAAIRPVGAFSTSVSSNVTYSGRGSAWRNAVQWLAVRKYLGATSVPEHTSP